MGLLVHSGGHNRPMHALMSNNEAEEQGETILNHGASLIDNIRGQKRTWGKGNRRDNDGRNTLADTNVKRKKFLRPNDN